MKKIILIIIVFFLLWNKVDAQTHIYCATPTFSSVPANPKWLKLAPIAPNNVFRLTQGYVAGTLAVTNLNYADSVSLGNYPHYMQNFQMITYPLQQQILNGTVHIQIIAQKSTGSSSLIAFGIVFLRLINSDGSIAQEIDSTNSSFQPVGSGAGTSNYYFDYTFNNIIIQAGQAIGFDFGYRVDKPVTGSTERYTRNYNLNIVDLPIDNSTNPSGLAWIEFSQQLKFQYLPNHFF
jgi:hypothetical protein